jgi:hypothetical protein
MILAITVLFLQVPAVPHGVSSVLRETDPPRVAVEASFRESESRRRFDGVQLLPSTRHGVVEPVPLNNDRAPFGVRPTAAPLLAVASAEIGPSLPRATMGATTAFPTPSAFVPPGGFIAKPPELPNSRRYWIALGIAQHSAATFDAWSTRHVLAQRGRAEADPFLKPFAHSNMLYGAIQAGPALLDYFSRRMLKSNNRWMHRLWWVPQSAATVGFLFSGAHNLAN